MLQQKLREKLDEFNELALQKESADRQVLRQEEEIKRLEETNINIRKKMAELQEEVEKQKNIVKELAQVKRLHVVIGHVVRRPWGMASLLSWQEWAGRPFSLAATTSAPEARALGRSRSPW